VLARALAGQGFEVRATVTRPEACRALFGNVKDVTAEARGFTEETLSAFLQAGEADVVLDATHPFAARITRIAHDACKRLGVPYVRYERPDWPPPEGTIFADTFAETAEILPTLGKRVMLTTGAKQLKHFAGLHERLMLFARILPSPVSLEQAVAAGFAMDRIMCLRPPFSRELNKGLFQEYQTDVLVTKASGSEGGVVEKVTAALELGMKIVMVRRPLLTEIVAVDTLEEAVRLCLEAAPSPQASLRACGVSEDLRPSAAISQPARGIARKPSEARPTTPRDCAS